MKGIVRTKRPMKLRNWLCAGMLVTATTAAAQARFCYHLVNPSKCGVEYAPVPDECISVTCQSKLDCSLMTLDKEGTWGCPTMGCFCVAYQMTVISIPSPNPEKGPELGCGEPKTITVAPPGYGGSATTGLLGTGTCFN